ncbi:MAG TPA: tryptophan-rich sensory protein [Planctomycetes bacterium]|nr:tryptophan-rich sensory protein [Planctomycetota bacterium]
MKASSVFNLLIAVGISFCASFIGSVATFSGDSFGWYDSLKKPVFTPPGWLFGPVWTLLYLMMGIAAFLVWQKGLTKSRVRIALAFFIVQLAFNAAWSVIFFGFHSAGWALFDIVFLWLAILATIVSFWGVNKFAAVLLLPYIGWVSFAAILNTGFYWLNR